jgi:hypothetical protein
VGILVSLVVRKRWLSLAGLGVLFLGIVLGPIFHSRWLTGALFLTGIALMLLQIPFGLRYDMRVMKGSDHQAKP